MRLALVLLALAVLAAPAFAACNPCDGIGVCGRDFCCNITSPDTVCPQDFGDWSVCNAQTGGLCDTCDMDCDNEAPVLNPPGVWPQALEKYTLNPITFTAGSCTDSCAGLDTAPYAVAYADVSGTPGISCDSVASSTYDSFDSGFKADAVLSFNGQTLHYYCIRLGCRDRIANKEYFFSVGKVLFNDTIPDTTPPETTITSAPSGWINVASATITFIADEPSTFECKLDSGSFLACTSPKAYNGLDEGNHTVEVRAKDLAGNTDLSPANASFAVDTRRPDTVLMAGDDIPTIPSENNTVVMDGIAGASFQGIELMPGSGIQTCFLDWGDNTIQQIWPPQMTATHTYYANGVYHLIFNCTDNVGWRDLSPAEMDLTVNVPVSDSDFLISDFGCGTGSSEWSTDSIVSATLYPAAGWAQCNISWNNGITWDIILPPTLCIDPHIFGVPEGIFTVLYNCKNAMGSWGIGSTKTITVDTYRPTIFLVNKTPDPTKDTDIRYNGTSSDNPLGKIGLVEYYYDSSSWDNATADFDPFNTNWEPFHFSILGLTEGLHSIHARAFDQAGGESVWAIDHVVVDHTEPDTTFTDVPTDPTTDLTPEFNGTASDTFTTISRVEYQVDSGSWNLANPIGNWGQNPQPFTFTTPILSQGLHTVRARAIDQAGNIEATPASYTFTINVIGPQVLWLELGALNGTPSEYSGTYAVYAWWWVEDTADSCEINWNVATGGAWNFTSPGTPDSGYLKGWNYSMAVGQYTSNGTKEVALRCSDAGVLGNTETHSIVVDVNDPVTLMDAFTTPRNTNATITGNAWDIPLEGIVTLVQYNVNGSPWTNATSLDGLFDENYENYTFTTALSDGLYAINARAIDAVGRISPVDSKQLIIDTREPNTILTSVPADDDPSPTYTGIAEDDDTIIAVPISRVDYNVTLDGISFMAGSAMATDGAFDEPNEDFTFTILLAGNGVYGVRVWATDEAGNVESTPASDSFSITTMGAPVFLSGYVFNQTVGVPLPNARVRIIGQQNYDSYTDSNGSYLHPVLSNRVYTVIASSPGFGPEVVYNVFMNQSREINFTLFPQASLCQDDCTMGDSICYADCEGWNNCYYFDINASQLCNMRQPGFVVDYDGSRVIDCCEGSPHSPLPTRIVEVNASEQHAVRVTRIVMKDGVPVRMVVDVVE
ncbi:MAG: carboxypeptidase regulatory-like domain-containing protein [Nanoarchaeota archaeon]